LAKGLSRLFFHQLHAFWLFSAGPIEYDIITTDSPWPY
jgi:hypothetical protein